MRHEAQSTYAHQCPGAFGAAAGEAPAQGLFLLQGRHDEIRRSEEVPHPRDHRRTLVQTIRRSRRGGGPRRQAWPEARRGEAQAVRRTDEGAEKGSHRQDAGSAEVRLCAMVFKGDKGIRATRVRHVHLAPHGAPVHAEDGLHLSVPGEGRKGAEPGSREEMAGNGLPRHKEGGRGKRFGDILGGRIVGSDLRNKGARLFPGRGLACPCRASKQVNQVQHDFRCQQQGRNAVHGLRRGDERRHLQGFHDEACEGLAMQGVPDSGQLANPPCEDSRHVAGRKQPEDQTLLPPKLFAGTQSRRISQQRREGVACGKEAPSDGKSPESGRRGAPVSEEERAGICQAAISQEGSALCR